MLILVFLNIKLRLSRESAIHFQLSNQPVLSQLTPEIPTTPRFTFDLKGFNTKRQSLLC